MLRIAVGVGAAILLLAGLVLAFSNLVFLELAAAGAVVLAGVLFEARRYRSRLGAEARRWQDTDERFIDPTTGHLVQVRFDPASGERDYVDLGPVKPGT